MPDSTPPPPALPGFYERLMSMVEISHPRFVVASDDDIKAAQEALKRQDLSDAARQQHQLMVNATVHPASGEPISAFVRVASIAPVNIPLIFLMLKCPSSNVPGTLFLHWVNQSYNALTNYSHRSGNDVDMQASLKAYGLAVTSACGLAYGLGKAYVHLGRHAVRYPPSHLHLRLSSPSVTLTPTPAAPHTRLSFLVWSQVRTCPAIP